LDSIAGAARSIVGGVDTHLELHHAAVVDTAGEILATRSFATPGRDTGRCWRGCAVTAS
jgi:hypothetical protein